MLLRPLMPTKYVFYYQWIVNAAAPRRVRFDQTASALGWPAGNQKR